MRTRSFRTGWHQAWRAHRFQGVEYTDTKAIVIPQAKTIYVPMPKAANSSARRALLPTLGIDPDSIEHIQLETKSLTEPCSTALPKAGPDWFVFTIVRHPYERAHSAWRNKLEEHDTPFKPLKSMGLERGDSFRTFLIACNLWPRKMLNDHFIPQTDLLQQAMKVPGFRIFQMEDLGTAWPEICDEIEARGGVRPSAMPHLNPTRKPIKLDFSASERMLLKRLYGRDFAPLGY